MKRGPVLLMVLLILLGVWLVLQPTLARGRYDMSVRVGPTEVLANILEDGRVKIVAPPEFAALGPMTGAEFHEAMRDEWNGWLERPGPMRTLFGFLNISGWGSFLWVAIGLLGQAAFFGRMLVQWIVSEKHRRSEVPVLFWWFSLLGGVCLFAYFVWRVDIIGVLGQSAGVVIYARNLRLIQKEKERLG